MTIPALVILKCLDEDDKGICRNFFPPMYGEKPVLSDDEEVPNVDPVKAKNDFE